MKLLAEEDKNTKKNNKKRAKHGFAQDTRFIVATMTPIVPR
jgi:hypothetical protein